jgi:hypothetical protein
LSECPDTEEVPASNRCKHHGRGIEYHGTQALPAPDGGMIAGTTANVEHPGAPLELKPDCFGPRT